MYLKIRELFGFSSIFNSAKIPAFGKDNLQFPGSADFENSLDFRTEGDVR